MFAAYTGKYYDGPGNHFWQALHMSGLLENLMCAEDDHKLLDMGMGFTNIVARWGVSGFFFKKRQPTNLHVILI